jgi:PAS domain S-box-containing protein
VDRLDARVTRTTTWIAAVVALATTLLLPAAYFLGAYQRLTGVLEAEVGIVAENLSRVIAGSPEMWDVQVHRLEGILAVREGGGGHGERRRVLDAHGVEVLAVGPAQLVRPALMRTSPLFDAGVTVGRLEISRSVAPLLARTAAMALVGVLLGGGVFVTLRVLPLRALRRSADRFQAVARSSTDAIVLVDDGGRIAAWNPSAERMFRCPEAGALGLPFATLVAPEDREGFDRLWAARAEPAPRPAVELTGVRGDGSLFPVELSLSAWRQGEAVHASSIIRDISERKRTAALLRQQDEQLREAQRLEAVGRLAAGVAHDFNNVLTIVGGRAAFVLDRLGPGDPLRSDIEPIVSGVERAARLVRQLLASAAGRCVSYASSTSTTPSGPWSRCCDASSARTSR